MATTKLAPRTQEDLYASKFAGYIVDYNRIQKRLPPPHLKGTDFSPPLTTALDVRTRIVNAYRRSIGDFEQTDTEIA